MRTSQKVAHPVATAQARLPTEYLPRSLPLSKKLGTINSWVYENLACDILSPLFKSGEDAKQSKPLAMLESRGDPHYIYDVALGPIYF